jgi:hypothetical protein
MELARSDVASRRRILDATAQLLRRLTVESFRGYVRWAQKGMVHACHVLREILTEHPVSDRVYLAGMADVIDDFCAWPEPWCFIARRMMAFLGEEIHAPGTALRRRIARLNPLLTAQGEAIANAVCDEGGGEGGLSADRVDTWNDSQRRVHCFVASSYKANAATERTTRLPLVTELLAAESTWMAQRTAARAQATGEGGTQVELEPATRVGSQLMSPTVMATALFGGEEKGGDGAGGDAGSGGDPGASSAPGGTGGGGGGGGGSTDDPLDDDMEEDILCSLRDDILRSVILAEFDLCGDLTGDRVARSNDGGAFLGAGCTPCGGRQDEMEWISELDETVVAQAFAVARGVCESSATVGRCAAAVHALRSTMELDSTLADMRISMALGAGAGGGPGRPHLPVGGAGGGREYGGSGAGAKEGVAAIVDDAAAERREKGEHLKWWSATRYQQRCVGVVARQLLGRAAQDGIGGEAVDRVVKRRTGPPPPPSQRGLAEDGEGLVGRVQLKEWRPQRIFRFGEEEEEEVAGRDGGGGEGGMDELDEEDEVDELSGMGEVGTVVEEEGDEEGDEGNEGDSEGAEGAETKVGGGGHSASTGNLLSGGLGVSRRKVPFFMRELTHQQEACHFEVEMHDMPNMKVSGSVAVAQCSR